MWKVHQTIVITATTISKRLLRQGKGFDEKILRFIVLYWFTILHNIMILLSTTVISKLPILKMTIRALREREGSARDILGRHPYTTFQLSIGIDGRFVCSFTSSFQSKTMYLLLYWIARDYYISYLCCRFCLNEFLSDFDCRTTSRIYDWH